MFATIKNLIPEPRQADQPRRYVGRHREPEPQVAAAVAEEKTEITADETAAA